MNMDVSNWACSGCSLGKLTGKFPCVVDYTLKSTQKKYVLFGFHSLRHILSHGSAMHLFTITGFEKIMSSWRNSFTVIELKFNYPLLKILTHLQQKTAPLRELMLSTNIWFYSNLVLTDGCTSNNCKDFTLCSCPNEVHRQVDGSLIESSPNVC